MKLIEAKLNTNCVVTSIGIKDEKTKIRLMELGLNVGTSVKVVARSLMKKTLLVIFNSACFSIKSDIASEISVKYA